MFDAVRSNQKIIQIVLALITLPFAFWGIDSYVRTAGGGNDAASVGGSKISAAELQQAMREQQDRLRKALGGRVDPAMLDSPELRRGVLDSLISRRLVAVYANKSKLAVTDDQLARYIASVPVLQENGQFSPQRYEAVIAAQGLSKPAFEAGLRQDMVVQQPMLAVADASLTGKVASDRWLAAQLEEREVSEATLLPDQYLAAVKLAPDAVKTFYEANLKQFEIPEQLRAEYLVLSRDQLMEQVSVGDDEIKAWYQSHADRYKQAEERRASHILIQLAKNAPAAEVKAAEAKAADVLAQIKKAPGDFAKLAKQYSADPGSAQKGGDLDWFGRGMMVKPFEEAAFTLKDGQLSDVVRSDFGLHIIKVTGVRGEQAKPLEAVRGEIAAELKAQAAAKKYADLAETFSNTVYEQADSLKPAAEKFKLAIQQSDWLVKGAPQASGPLANAKLAAALFSDDAVKNKRNTEAVEISPNVLVAARVLEHKPAARQSLETVTPSIEKLLAHQEAAKLAAKAGEDKLAKLLKGEKTDLVWSSPKIVARATAQNMSPDAVRLVFKADAAKLPAFVGADGRTGYTIYRVSQVKPFADGDAKPQTQALRSRYARIVAEEEFSAWMAALKDRFPVEINQAVLEAKEK